VTSGVRCRVGGLAVVAVSACVGKTAGLDTTCPDPDGGAGPEQLFAEMATRGIVASPDTVRFRLGGSEVVVGWKNLLSGRALTLSCAYRCERGGWRLLRERLDEGTHAIEVTGRTDPPGLIYRDAAGRLLDVVALHP
jgi:hypothetical protein